MSALQDRRNARADELCALAQAEADKGDYLAMEKAGNLWADAHDVRRGHADEPEWLVGP